MTPFRQDGSLDEQALYALTQWQIESGIDWLVACGTTAETPTLTDDEWLQVLRIVTEAAAGRIPVWAGCTHNATRQAVERAKLAARVPGVAAILSASPYYNKPTQEGQFEHFKAVARAVDLPVVLYNIPARTGVNLEPATVLRLAEAAENIRGIKESSSNLAQITELITQLHAISGCTRAMTTWRWECWAWAARGWSRSRRMRFPERWHRWCRRRLRMTGLRRGRLNRKYYRLMLANFWETSPGPVKAVLSMMGKIGENYRLAIASVSPGNARSLERLAGELGLLVHGPQSEGDLRMF